jgi:hypothetical protein
MNYQNFNFKKMKTHNIAVLEFSTGQVLIYANIELTGLTGEDTSEMAERFLIQRHNLDEINYMFSENNIEVEHI